MKAIILLISIINIYSFKFFLKNKFIININNPKPIIVDSKVELLKKNYLFYLSKINNIQIKEYTFDKFILEKPYLTFSNILIYINDFLPKKGRVFNSYEKDILLNFKNNNNLIIFNSKSINNIKDKNLIKNFDIYRFPKLSKIDIINYIYDIIDIEKYDNALYILNWNNYINIEKINIEKINILLFEINNMFQNNIPLNIIHDSINDIINSLV